MAEHIRVLTGIPVRTRAVLIQGATGILFVGLGVVIGKTLAWVLVAVALTIVVLLSLATVFDGRRPDGNGALRSAPASSASVAVNHQGRGSVERGASPTRRVSDLRPAAAKKALEASAREAEQLERLKREIREDLAYEAREADPIRIKLRQQEAERAKRRLVERGEDLAQRIGAVHIQAKATGMTIAAGLVLDELTAQVERWASEAGIAEEPPHVAETTPTGGDFARLKQYVEAHLHAFA